MDMRLRIGAATLLCLFVACGTQPTPKTPEGSASVSVTLPTAKPAYTKHVAAAAELVRFADCTAVTKTLRAEALPYVGPYGIAGAGSLLSGGFAAEDKAAAPAAAAPTGAQSATPGVDYSTTNVQEQGVDEPDLALTDGRRIFVIQDQTIHAAVISSDTPRLVGALKIDVSGAQLLLDGDRLIAIGGDPTGGGGIEPMIVRGGNGLTPPSSYSEKTIVEIIDVSNPSAMRVESTLHLDGTYIAARSVKGIVRIVVRRSSPNIAFTTPTDGNPVTENHALAVNRDIVAKAGVDKWIPRYTLRTPKGASSGQLSSCSTTYAPRVFSGLSTVTVVSVDPAHPTPQNGSTVVGGGETVYASQDALYVTAQKWDPPQPYAASSKGAVSAPAVVAPSPSSAETQIHKFSITGPSAHYLASGLVSGTLLNSYAMSEFDGNLRVASTTTKYGVIAPTAPNVSSSDQVPASSSAVTVFAEEGQALVPVGHVGGLGAGEQIRGVRFIGPVAYVVTFRQTDPLYTVDLSNPVAPKVAGELKIPGFSAYLHPVGDGLLLGIGEVADAQGHVHDDQGHWFGTKVSLFDVHNPAHPTEIATHVIPGGSSGVEQEPHAFLWWAPRKLAVIPVSSYDSQSFHGAVGMHVDRTISEVGRIPDPDTGQTTYFGPGIERALVVGDRLYTLSPTGIGSSDIATFARKTWLPFGS
jgi:uncharacterized secreted protein with C-terminal beta-propeller domain